MGKVSSIEDALPTTEAERTEEVHALLSRLTAEDTPNLTTWETQMIAELLEGKAATKIRLKELREAVKRIENGRQAKS